MVDCNELHKIVDDLSYPEIPDHDELKKMANWRAPYYHFLYRLAERVGNDLGYWVVFGVNQAVCCSHIMTGNPGVELVGIDYNRTDNAVARSEKYGFTYRVHSSHAPDTVAYFQKLHKQGKRIGVVFFDTVHTKEQVMGEWQRVQHFIGGHAILLFDDVHVAGNSVMEAVNKISGRYHSLDHLHEVNNDNVPLGFGVKVYCRSS